MHNSLSELYAGHKTGKLSDKWELYLDVYARVLAPLRDRPINLVEVGIQNGGSLELWSQFFPNAKMLVGCDVDPRCELLRYADPRIHVVVGPINERTTFDKIMRLADRFDIFIDDGSHHSADINCSFYNYFHRVRAGGLYIIEDLHCAYWQDYGGGLGRPSGAMGFLRLLVDGLNRAHWKEAVTLGQMAAPYLPPGTEVDDSLASDIRSISFYDSMCVIEKSVADGRDRLGTRLIVGDEAMVAPSVTRFRG
jgi:hypothetical protein